jgi:hypothetical protein
MHTDVALASLAENNLGLVSVAAAVKRGITAGALRHHARRGLLAPVQPGVFAHTAVTSTRLARLTAALHAAGPRAVASHRSALALWGLTETPEPTPELTVTGSALPRLDGVVTHRTRHLPPHHRTLRSGLAVTTVERTLADIGAVVPLPLVRDCVEQALIDERTTYTRLLDTVDELAAPGRNGIGVLRRVLGDWLLDDTRPDSKLEPMMARLVHRHGLPPPRFHYIVRDDDGAFVAEVDAAWPAAKVVAEVDGLGAHRHRSAFQRDLTRQNRLVLLGYTVLRFTWHDIVRRPRHVADTMTSALLAALGHGQPAESHR